MLAQSIVRASRSSLPRAAVARLFQSRTFITPTAIRQADFVQELYLRELRTYKPSPIKASDAEGQVKLWKVPSSPTAPNVSALAAELPEYVAQEVEVERGEDAVAVMSTEKGEVAVESDWFEEDVEEEGHGKH